MQCSAVQQQGIDNLITSTMLQSTLCFACPALSFYTSIDALSALAYRVFFFHFSFSLFFNFCVVAQVVTVHKNLFIYLFLRGGGGGRFGDMKI